jgi:predicted metal-dependent phosphoesterase TrpH
MPQPSTRVDLHIHSTASDGRWTPQQVVSQVAQTGIGLFAVADHDTVDSVSAVERFAQRTGMGFLRAVEVTTTLDGRQFHLVAYGIDPAHPVLLEMLRENWEKLTSVDDQSIEKLIGAGYDLDLEEYAAYRHDPTRGGWKALNFLIDQGICRDVKDFFGRLFTGEMALTYPTFYSPDRAVRIIEQAGGTAVCAHPGHSNCDGEVSVLEQLVDCGVRGFECFSPYHDPQVTRFHVDFCRRHGLLITAGSDCHGGFVNRALGQPEAYLRDLNLGPLLSRIVY